MAKQIRVQCPSEAAGIMIEALRWFVDRHYPSGADECSIAARDALFGLAHQFEDALLAQGHCSYSIRMRAFLCEAVRAYLQELAARRGESFSHRSRVLIEICRGETDGVVYAEAARRDAEMPDQSV